MDKLSFSVRINASAEKVWKALWQDESYREWTSVFAEGSFAETSNWEEGTNVLFLDGKGNGMVSVVAVNKPNEFMSFKHLGTVKNGVQDLSSEKVSAWAGATENYRLINVGGNTELEVEMDTTNAFRDYFQTTWPRALEKIRRLSEQ